MSRVGTPVPPQLPGFDYQEVLGSGGFSDVFKYTQVGLGRAVAVKVLHGGVDDSDHDAFQAEARLMAQLSNHPSIVSIYQADVTADGRGYLVMEFCPSAHLGTRARNRPLSVSKALEVTIQVAGAVETAHQAGILHRDIKPANILFTEFGRPALTDFGISVATSADGLGEGIGMSVPWAPPEQLSSGTRTGATGDVYSLAATLWTALVGRSPFFLPQGANDTMALASRVRTRPVPRTQRDDVPDHLERILEVAMSKRPEDRFGSAEEFARALQRVQAESHLSVTPIDVGTDHLMDDPSDEEVPGGTRVTGFVSIDPEGRAATPVVPSRAPVEGAPSDTSHTGGVGDVDGETVTRDRLFAGTAGAADVEAEDTRGSARRPATPDTADRDVLNLALSHAAEPAGRPSRRVLAFAGVAAAAVVALTATAVLGGEDGTDARTTSGGITEPADPFGSTVPGPEGLRVRSAAGGVLLASWKNPDPQPGDRFAVRALDPVDVREWRYTTAFEARVRPAPGSTCVQVALVRADGTFSATAAKECA